MSSAAYAQIDESALKESIINVNGYKGRNIESEGSGFVVHSDRYNGYVVTNAEVVRDRDTVTVNVPVSGAELVAQVVQVDESLDFALLKVNGLERRPLHFAGVAPEAGDVVWSAIKWTVDTDSLGLSKGTLRSSYRLTKNDVGVLIHTAMIAEGGIGSVLLNECGHVLGLNMGVSSSGGNVRAIDTQSLRSLLANQNIKTLVATDGCVSPVAMARQEAERASREAREAIDEAVKAQIAARELERMLEETEGRNEELVRQTRAARERADEAVIAAEEARQNAENTRVEFESKTSSMMKETRALMDRFEKDQELAEQRFQDTLTRQQEEARMRERMYLGIGVVLLAVITFGLLTYRGRVQVALAPEDKEQAKVRSSKTQLQKSEPAEYVLDGRDEDGIRYLLRISGDQLNTSDGAIIGRNPKDSPYIINHADVSRRHARIKVMKNRIFIEDLGSTNGTSVNGQSIEDKGPISVDDGDQIIIGSVVMKLRVIAA